MTSAESTIEAGRSWWYVLIGLIVVVAISGCSRETTPNPRAAPAEPLAADPLDATYWIDGSEIPLSKGHFEMPAAPGSAAMVTATVFDTPAYGDLDGSGDIDAAVILVYQTGGSGTFYYIAAAINGVDGYRGTNAMLLGDRVIPQTVRIQNRVIIADFADRRPGEPMAATPTIDVTRYAYLDGDSLVAVPADREESGWVTFGHEVRSFLPCDRSAEHWVLGRSSAISDIERTYRNTMTDARPYTPLFMVLTGSFAKPPRDGFGADYAGGIFVTGLIEADPAGHCRKEFIGVESPAPGAVIESPLTIRGRARGTWFFEGDFPVVLEDVHGNIVANGFVTAQGEWMTKEFVPFTAMLSFAKPEQGGRGSLIFKKDNPSEQRELDDEMAIPVFFQE
jgi:hypothetical protein